MSLGEVSAAVMASAGTEQGAISQGAEGLAQFDEGVAIVREAVTAIEGLIGQLGSAKEKFSESSGTYGAAEETAEEANGQLNQALAGWEHVNGANEAISAFAANRSSLDDMSGRAAAAELDVDAVLALAQTLLIAANEAKAQVEGVSSEAAEENGKMPLAISAAETVAASL